MEDNVTEVQASAGSEAVAAEKPVRKRASRRVTAPAGEAAAAVTVEVVKADAAAAPAEAAAPAPAEDAAPAAAEAPKKRAPRSRKKAVDAEAEAAAPAVETAPAEAPAAEAPKKRAPRSRKKAVDTEAAVEAVVTEPTGAAADAVTAEPANAEAPAAAEAPVKRTRRARVSKVSQAAESAAETAAADQIATEAAEASATQQAAKAAVADAPSVSEDNAATDKNNADQSDAEKNNADEGQADKRDAEVADEKPARGRGRGRRNQKQEAAEAAETAQADTASNDSKGQNQKNQRAQRGGEQKPADGQNGPETNKADKNNESRSSRTRQRDRKRRGQNDDLEPEITEDDVLLPIAGILDILDNYAFVRTSGYLPGTSDVYVSLGQVKKYGMKRGDAVVGAIRQPREGEQTGRQKYNAIVKVDSVNGRMIEENESRVEFSELPAIYPERQLTLGAGSALGREIDAAAPVGFGQRGLLVVPQPARGIEVLAQIAGAVTATAPDAHLMLLLTNAQPEDITHLTRSVNGEVIAASFERPAEDQATIAELGIERAKRLAELGHDVVVLVDSVGDLARAYAQAQPATARPAVGVIDEFATSQVRRVLGAARNVENGGSVTILATAAVKTGFAADKQLLRELRPVANCEIRFAVTSSFAVSVEAEHSRTRGASALHITSAA